MTVHSNAGYVLKSEDVGVLMDCLHQYAYKWREIGTALRFLPGELECIVLTFSRDGPHGGPQRLLKELLNIWCQWPIATHPDVPTVERLESALRSGPVGLGAVANNLRSMMSS